MRQKREPKHLRDWPIGEVRTVQWWLNDLPVPEGAVEHGEPRDCHHHYHARLIEWV